MQVAEEADRAAVGTQLGQHGGMRRLGEALDRLHRRALLVQQPEILAVEVKVRRVLAREHRVGLRSGGDEDRPRGKRRARELVPDAVAVVVMRGHREPGRASARIDLDRKRRQPLGEADALLQRLFDFFVVERVRRAVDQPPPIGDGRRRPTRAISSAIRVGRPSACAFARSARIARACARNS